MDKLTLKNIILMFLENINNELENYLKMENSLNELQMLECYTKLETEIDFSEVKEEIFQQAMQKNLTLKKIEKYVDKLDFYVNFELDDFYDIEELKEGLQELLFDIEC